MGVNASLKNDVNSGEDIAHLLSNREERAKVFSAKDNPDCRLAKEVINKYKPYFRFAGKDISFGSQESFKLQSMVLESAKRFQPPTEFITLNFTTKSNPLIMRLAQYSVSNKEFPAIFETGCVHGANGDEFMEKLAAASRLVAEGTLEGLHPGHTANARMKLTMESPVAVVKEQMRMINDVCCILLGLPLESFFSATDSQSRRKTRHYSDSKGICGHPLSVIGVTEDDGKGALHFHLLFFGGIPPSVLQRFANITKVSEAIAAVLDSIHTSRFPVETHLAALIPKVVAEHPDWGFDLRALVDRTAEEPLLKRTDGAVAALVNEPPTGVDSFRMALEQQTCGPCKRSQNHDHLNTCHHGVMGIDGCRFCMPAGECNGTHAVLVVPKVAGVCDGDGSESDDGSNPFDTSLIEERMAELSLEAPDEDPAAAGATGAGDGDEVGKWVLAGLRERVGG